MHDPGRVHKTLMSVIIDLSAEMYEGETRSCGKCSEATCIITDLEKTFDWSVLDISLKISKHIAVYCITA